MVRLSPQTFPEFINGIINGFGDFLITPCTAIHFDLTRLSSSPPAYCIAKSDSLCHRYIILFIAWLCPGLHAGFMQEVGSNSSREGEHSFCSSQDAMASKTKSFLLKKIFKNNKRKRDNYLLKLYIFLQGNIYPNNIASFFPGGLIWCISNCTLPPTLQQQQQQHYRITLLSYQEKDFCCSPSPSHSVYCPAK